MASLHPASPSGLRCASVPNTSESTAIPITRITIITAMRPDEFASSRFTLSKKPSDGLPAITTISSPAIRLRHANAHPCLSPPTNDGNDAGSTTWR